MQTKVCSKCKEEKTVDLFYKHPTGLYGVNSSCKACHKLYAQANKEKTNARTRKYRAARREEDNKRCLEYYHKNREKCIERNRVYKKKNREVLAEKRKIQRQQSEADKLYRENNRHLYAAWCRQRQARKLEATPVWAKNEKDHIAAMYKTAKETGQQVDHIVPLQGKLVCGLHCLANLQLLTPEENRKKHNSFEV